MNLLAIDTSTDRAAVAVGRADGAVFVAAVDPSRRHGRNLVPAVGEALRAADLRPVDLDVLAVGLGPGSYTGLRIGVTAAKTLAYAAGRPLATFDSLAAIAANAPADALSVSVIVDAQRGDLFVADFARAGAGGPLIALGATRVESAVAWSVRLAAGVFVLGPGLGRLAVTLPEGVATGPPDSEYPDPHRSVALARSGWPASRIDDFWFLEPIYLRRSAAEDQWERRDA